MKVGSKVLCVDDKLPEGFEPDHWDNWISKGTVYTIREFLHNDDIVTGVLLKEVRNRPIYQKLIGRYQEPAFRLSRFVQQEEETMQNSFESELEISLN